MATTTDVTGWTTAQLDEAHDHLIAVSWHLDSLAELVADVLGVDIAEAETLVDERYDEGGLADVLREELLARPDGPAVSAYVRLRREREEEARRWLDGLSDDEEARVLGQVLE
jgi:hypothetical protein